MMPNVPQYPVAVAAILRAGFVVVNVNPLYTPRELEHQLKDSGSKAIVIIENFANTLQQCIANTPVKHVVLAAMGDQLGLLKGALVNYVVRNVKKMVPAFSLPGAVRFNDAIAQGTRGTLQQARDQARRRGGAAVHRRHHRRVQGRGAPAPQRHRQRAAVRGLEPAGDGQGAGRRAAHRRLRAAALSHLRLHGGHDAVHAHRRQADPDPEPARPAGGAQGRCRKQTFHSFPAVNTLFNGLANHPDFNNVNWKNLKVSVGGGMAVQGAVAKLWLEKTGCPICEGYGLSETSPSASCNPTTSTEYTGTIGVPLPSTYMKLLDDDGNEVPLGQPGEIAIKGPQVMAGYWQRPDETAKVMTRRRLLQVAATSACMDERGYFKIVDRKKDMVLVSGFNVYPNEVEDVVAQLDGVLECAVVGVADEKTGEAVKLVIVKKDPGLTEEQGARVLPRQPHRLQAAQGDRVPHRPAQDAGRQDPAARAARQEVRPRPRGPSSGQACDLSMLRFILTRLSLIIPTFIGMTLLAFFLIRLVPGDPIETLAGERGIDAARHAAAAQGIRARPAGARAVRHLHRPRAARRPRQIDHHAGAGAARVPRAVSGHGRAGDLRHPVRAAAGHSGRHHCGRQAQLGVRSRRDGDVAHRLLDADLLVGPAADPAVLGAAGPDAGVGPHRRAVLHRADHRLPADRLAADGRQGRVLVGACST